MKKRFIAGIVVIAVAASAVAYMLWPRPEDKHEVVAKVLSESDYTKMVPVLNVPLGRGNVIWSVTFQLAWNELVENVIGEGILLESERAYSTELNLMKQKKESLDPDDYMAMVGMGRDGIVEKVNTELEKKFGEGGKWKVESKVDPESYLAYAFLKKSIAFAENFEKVTKGLDFKGVNVQSFGIMEEGDAARRGKLESQVELLYYKDDEEFIVRLKDKDDKEELYLAKLPGEDTLEAMLEKARSLEGTPAAMTRYDKLNVPVVAIDMRKDYETLIGQYLLNKGFESYFIGSALQRMEFVLNESGAALKSKAEIVLDKSVPPPSKNLIFDDSFLLYMVEKGKAVPYLVIYVDNAELLNAK
ncbi:hypothetical protein [Youngiibacter fragilis]|uniref:Uncharacterized protein n=1 Tax=Youngiibacter fragilis 232.1 TaxID=994573 RepID=V7I5E6_9CLOT|nr:hypothetical protein [Youngiibacter fragilis]ETA80419.1 hypothetical protein T472_0211690 [Youngiibacter fragilis 232.1]